MPKDWEVEYEATYRGKTVVSAETAKDAEGIVQLGDFSQDRSAERVDWRVVGLAREVK